MEEQSEQRQTNAAETNDTQWAAPKIESVSWTASEYVAHQKTTGWYVALGCGSAVMTLLVFIITRSLLSGFVVALSCMALGIFAARQPQTKKYAITEEGIVCGDKGYPYSLFKSYSIVDEDAISCIWLRPLKRFMPTVVMYYGPDDEEKIVDMLDNFLPQEDRQHDVVDRISRRIRF